MRLREFRIFSFTLVVALIFGGSLSTAPAAGAKQARAQNASWFQPTLTTKTEAICDSFLTGIRAKSSGIDGLKDVPTFFSEEDRGNSSVQSVADQPDYLVFERSSGHPLYVEHIRYPPGCGGACEREGLGLHGSAPPKDGSQDAEDKTPASESWSIYETTSGQLYVAAVVDRYFEVYRAGPDAHWKLSCRIQLEPDFDHMMDPQVKRALASTHTLAETVEDMAMGEGTGRCGTMHTASLWQDDFDHALGQVLFDPEATAVKLDIPSENSYGDYPRIYPALQQWALGGMYEHEALQRYDRQLADTISVVQSFYEYGFHWSQEHAAEVARRSIQGAVSRRFGFYMYDPYPTSGEAELRQALLTHQPMAAVRATSVDFKELNSSSNDSILNVAIDYPEALSYLLGRGISADVPNEFGKTPLMYAVQHDQAAAVRMLLQAGADPNATTNGGADNCDYALKWRNVTPLHYAVRYASRDVVQALLDAGAVTFIRAESDSDSSRGGYPLEWLKRVTPRKLSPVDVTALEILLRVPSDAERVQLSATFAAKAEAANSARRPLEAYRAIREAQLADPTNYRAAEDLPLLALKAGELGFARQGSDTALTMAKTPADQAAALFNKGLVCERIQYSPRAARAQGAGCDNGDYIDAFVRSWKLQPSSARVKALVQRLGADEASNCTVTDPSGGKATFRFFARFDSKFLPGQAELMYVLHPRSLKIDPSTIHWASANDANVTSNPNVLETLTLDQDHELSILEGGYFAKVVFVGTMSCYLGDTASSAKPN